MRLRFLRNFLFPLFLLFLIGLSAQAQAPKKKVIRTRILFVLDVSGSMTTRLDNSTRWNVARDLLSEIVDSLKTVPHLEMALRAYGHQYENRLNNCQDTRLEVPFGPNTAPQIQSKLKVLKPKGNTPISYSLLQSANDFTIDPYTRNILILITDGLESCNEDPCKISLELQKKRVFMRPYIVGIGTDKEFGQKLDCIGQFLNASSAKDLKRVLTRMITQALKKTTVSVSITDHQGRPYENNLNMTFINNATGQPQYNYVHYDAPGNRVDTLNIDPVLSYDLQINTIPPVYRKELPIIPGRHNEIKIPAPQGVLQFRQDGLASTRPIYATIKPANKENTINHQQVGIKERYLAGRYDVEVLTLPRIVRKDVEVKPNDITVVNVPIAGVLNMTNPQPGYGTVYELLNDGTQRWIYNFPDGASKINLQLQPGNYRVVFRTRSSRGSEFSDTKDFSISSGVTTTVRMF